MGCGRVVRVALPSRAISGGWDVRVSLLAPQPPGQGFPCGVVSKGSPTLRHHLPLPRHCPGSTARHPCPAGLAKPPGPFLGRPAASLCSSQHRPGPSSSLTLVFGRILLAFSRLVLQSSTCHGTHLATCFILLRFHFARKSSESLSPFRALVSCSVRRDSTMSGMEYEDGLP